MKRHSNIVDFFLTVITFGLYNIYIQFRQIEDANQLYNQNKYSLAKIFLFTILTFGMYFCYHEYKLTLDLQEKAYGNKKHLSSLWVIIATFFGIWPAVDSYQQALINTHLEKRNSLSRDNIIELVIVGSIYSSFVLIVIGYLLSKKEISNPLEYFFL